MKPLLISKEALASLETPCFIFDPARVIESYRTLRAALGTPLLVSLKANSHPSLLERCAQEFRDGSEIASVGELDLALRHLPQAKYVTSPALDETLILAASACKATIVLDSYAHANLLLRLLPRLGAPPAVMIRINATAILRHYTSDLRPDHFGVEPTEAGMIASRLHAAGVKVVGLHVFAGSGNFGRSAPYIVAAITSLIDEVSAIVQGQLPFVNLGGGFVADWAGAGHLMASYRSSLATLQGRMTVLHEAGRAIFEHGAKFLTRVVSVKMIHGGHVAVCDGGMAHAFQLAQTEKFVKAWSVPVLIARGSTDESGAPRDKDLPIRYVGNSCNPADILGVGTKGSVPRIGDVVVFERCGAYHTYTPSGFLNLAPVRKYLEPICS